MVRTARDDSYDIVRASLVGFGFGLVIGLLLAPAEGEVTRRRLLRSVRLVRDDFETKLVEMSGVLLGQMHELEAQSPHWQRLSEADNVELVNRAESVMANLHNWSTELAANQAEASKARVEDMQLLLDAGDSVMSELELATKQLLSQPETKPLAEPEI